MKPFQTSSFRLHPSDFILQTSSFRLHPSDFICVEMGYLTREQVEAIIESSRVRQLPSYLRRDKAPASRPVEVQNLPRSPLPHPEILKRLAKDPEKKCVNYEELLALYRTAGEQVQEQAKTIEALREQNRSLSIRAEIAENEVIGLRRKLQQEQEKQTNSKIGRLLRPK